MLASLVLTFLLGATFIGLEAHEFTKLITEGHGPQHSAFLSSFFTLVGTHGLHVSIGLLWLLVLMVYIGMRGLHGRSREKLFIFSLFWHFLDIVWICIFTFVYLFGVL
jgi:cytochrome o ubiquinol oxidase subunit 3